MNANPLDVLEVLSIDDYRVDSRRPIGLRQGHDEISRVRRVSLAGDQVKQEPDCGADRGINGKVNPEIIIAGEGGFTESYHSAEDRSEERIRQEIRSGRDAFHLYLNRIITRRFDPDDLALFRLASLISTGVAPR